MRNNTQKTPKTAPIIRAPKGRRVLEHGEELAILDDGSFLMVGEIAEHIHGIAKQAGVSDQAAFRVLVTLGFRGIVKGLVKEGKELPPEVAAFAR